MKFVTDKIKKKINKSILLIDAVPVIGVSRRLHTGSPVDSDHPHPPPRPIHHDNNNGRVRLFFERWTAGGGKHIECGF